jgi:hypothetical protein
MDRVHAMPNITEKLDKLYFPVMVIIKYPELDFLSATNPLIYDTGL